MKNTFLSKTLILLSAILALPALVSCSGDDPNETIVCSVADLSLTYEHKVWSGWDTNEMLSINGVTFSHSCIYYGDTPYWTGFVASKSTDAEYYPDAMYEHPFTSASGGGVKGADSPYLVGYWDTMETEATPFEERSLRIWHTADNGANTPFLPQSVFVNNTTYVFYTLVNGSAYSRKFEKGDFLKITAHGILPGGGESETSFYLADMLSDDEQYHSIINRWTPWDLTPLGAVEGIYFTIESSDVGIYGINTPTYVCLDNFAYYNVP